MRKEEKESLFSLLRGKSWKKGEDHELHEQAFGALCWMQRSVSPDDC